MYEFKQAHPSNFGGVRDTNNIKYIVVHYTGASGQTAKNNLDYFARTENLKSSAHYFIGEDGIMQSVRDNQIAWHCGTTGAYKHPECRNANSIGIELCLNKGGSSWYITVPVMDGFVSLVREKMKQYNIPIERVLRHYDVTGKNCPALYVQNERAWKEVLELIDTGKIHVETNPVYTTLEDIPEWAYKYVKAWVDAGCFSDPRQLNIDAKQLRQLVLTERRFQSVCPTI